MFDPSIHRRFVFPPPSEEGMPLIVESIGFNRKQEKISRPGGYPLYHWIQTVDGTGQLTLRGGNPISLPSGSGMLLSPEDEHAYEAVTPNWSTLYLTFGGSAAEVIVKAFGIQESGFFSFEPEARLDGLLFDMLNRLESGDDRFGLEIAADAYRFIGRLSKYGRLHHNMTITHNLEKLAPLLNWMELHLGDPEAGLEDFAAVLGVSGRRLNTLFQQTFGSSPYAYFLQIRMRKAKEMLVRSKTVTVSEVGHAVGFRDSSHFVATFRKAAGMTPEHFRKLH